MNQQYDDKVQEHRRLVTQMRLQLVENQGGETMNLYQQSPQQLSYIRQLIVETNQQIYENPSDPYPQENRDNLIIQLSRESEASGYISAHLPIDS
ncbi:hypothetical protein KBB48_02810 [Candidatus Shapirobacteria bacterium]|nr:hypothetical protein [Candidatus Shapirobacteria bacterium]